MKTLEKLMCFDEMIRYLNTHPQYRLLNYKELLVEPKDFVGWVSDMAKWVEEDDRFYRVGYIMSHGVVQEVNTIFKFKVKVVKIC